MSGAEIPDQVRDQLSRVTDQPGVYLMRDTEGRVIYVGKARQLKKRLAAYFKPAGPSDPKTGALLRHIAALETILTASENEALILESNLIKRHRPRYNVILKDDKRYPLLRLDPRHAYPRLTVARRMADDGARYFGPYASAGAVRATLRFINKTFRLRKCREGEFRRRTRPCLHHQMGTCDGPCCLPVDRKRYAAEVREVVLFLQGRTPQLIRRIRSQMETAAAEQRFEAAAVLRDRMFALERTLERQVAVTPDRTDRDVLAVARAPSGTVVTLLTVRSGFLLGSHHFDFPPTPADDAEVIAGFVRQYYPRGAQVPGELLVSALPEDAGIIAEQLAQLRGGRVQIRRPQRGDKTRLVQMAAENAAHRSTTLDEADRRRQAALAALARRLKLAGPPRRIECFDNSTTGGAETVAAMAVFTDGRPDPDAYRHYRLRRTGPPDDYAAMAEVLGRRFGPAGEPLPPPDLLLLDGGKGQLNVARRVLADLGQAERRAVAAIAKAEKERGETEDKVFLPGRANPVGFGRDAAARLLLEAVRDEAHRFAIGFHRRRRRRAAVASVLDGVPGIGPRRKRRLLVHFGGTSGLFAASVEALADAGNLPRPVAENLADHLRRQAAAAGPAAPPHPGVARHEAAKSADH